MGMRDIEWRKRGLLILIAATAIAPAFFISLDEPTRSLQAYKLPAKAGSLCGTVLIVWQFLLGFRAAAGKLLRDLIWVFDVHKTIGRYLLFLVVLHPVFITLYYLEKEGINPLMLQGERPFPNYVLLGLIAFGLFAAIVVSSALLRHRFSLYGWYGLHMSSYLALSLVFVHSFSLGMTIRETGLYRPWIGMMMLACLFFLFRVSFRLGFRIRQHEISRVKKVGPDVVKISARPTNGRVGPRLGQFIYLRWGLWGPTRPFTVSHYDQSTGEISVTVKALGSVTTRLQSIQPGEKVYIDGPYGVFSHAALETDRPLVMVAGGIGITPFMRIFEELGYEPDRELHLFYGNKRRKEVIYRDHVDNVEHANVIHVLSKEPNPSGETGYVTADLLEEHLTRELQEYEYLICGPPGMTANVEAGLLRKGVPDEQIHHELFDY